MKKKFSCILALAIVLSMSACGNTADNVPASEDPITAAESEAETSAEKSETETETNAETETEAEVTETESETEPEPEEDDDSALYAYYDTLCKEYDKYSSSMVREYSIFNYGINKLIIAGDMVLFWKDENIDGYYSPVLYSFDMNTKQLVRRIEQMSNTDICWDGFNLDKLGYYDGSLYFNWGCSVVRTDIDGKNPKTITADEAGIDSPNGSARWAGNGIFYMENYYDGVQTYKFFNGELEFIADGPMRSVGHGIKEPVCVSQAYCIGEYLYVYGDSTLFRNNISAPSEEWEELSYKLPSLYSDLAVIGKYIVDDDELYDSETGEVAAEFCYEDEIFYKSYFGGDSNIIWGEGDYWFRVQVPSDRSKIDFSKYEKMGQENGSGSNIFRANDTYYLFIDQYGVFLRTYEKGEAEEETIMMFEN